MLLTNATIATLRSNDSFGLIKDGAIALEGAHIAWTGDRTAVPQDYPSVSTQDLERRLLTPAMIDCHTHDV